MKRRARVALRSLDTGSRHESATGPTAYVGRRTILGMPEYRFYRIGSDGHFVSATPVVCKDDDEAIEQAKQFVDGLSIEIWRTDRLVKRLEAKRGK